MAKRILNFVHMVLSVLPAAWVIALYSLALYIAASIHRWPRQFFDSPEYIQQGKFIYVLITNLLDLVLISFPLKIFAWVILTLTLRDCDARCKNSLRISVFVCGLLGMVFIFFFDPHRVLSWLVG